MKPVYFADEARATADASDAWRKDWGQRGPSPPAIQTATGTIRGNDMGRNN